MDVKIDPQLLSDLSEIPGKGAGTNESVMNTLDNALNDLLNALNPLNGQPIVGSGITDLMKALDSAETALKTSMGCFGTGLRVMGPALKHCVDDFKNMDQATASSLTSLLQDLDRKLSGFENFGSTVTNLTHP